MKKEDIKFWLFVAALIFILIGTKFPFTGNAVENTGEVDISIFTYFGILLLISSFVVATIFSQATLTYLAIPASGGKMKKMRNKRAIKEIHNRRVEKVLVLKGKDSEEDILYLGKVVQKGDHVGFDTFPLHFREYKRIIQKAIKENKFPRGVKIENVRTTQPIKLFIYGIFGYLEEFLKRGVDYKKNRQEKFLDKIKKPIKKILGR